MPTFVLRQLLKGAKQLLLILAAYVFDTGIGGPQQIPFIGQAAAGRQLFAQAAVAQADLLLQNRAAAHVDQQLKQADAQLGNLDQAFAAGR